MNTLSCCKCGRFISYKDFDSGSIKQEEIWNNFPSLDLETILLYCIKCTERDKE